MLLILLHRCIIGVKGRYHLWLRRQRRHRARSHVLILAVVVVFELLVRVLLLLQLVLLNLLIMDAAVLILIVLAIIVGGAIVSFWSTASVELGILVLRRDSKGSNVLIVLAWNVTVSEWWAAICIWDYFLPFLLLLGGFGVQRRRWDFGFGLSIDILVCVGMTILNLSDIWGVTITWRNSFEFSLALILEASLWFIVFNLLDILKCRIEIWYAHILMVD